MTRILLEPFYWVAHLTPTPPHDVLTAQANLTNQTLPMFNLAYKFRKVFVSLKHTSSPLDSSISPCCRSLVLFSGRQPRRVSASPKLPVQKAMVTSSCVIASNCTSTWSFRCLSTPSSIFCMIAGSLYGCDISRQDDHAWKLVPDLPSSHLWIDKPIASCVRGWNLENWGFLVSLPYGHSLSYLVSDTPR